MSELTTTLRTFMAIDSPTGFFHAADDYLMELLIKWGFAPERLVKGGVRVELGGSGDDLCIAAHADTLGLMVRRVNPNGTLVVANLGGLAPFYCENANVRVYARGGRQFTGVMRRSNPSTHLMSEEERKALPDYDKNLFVLLDEAVTTKAETEALGIRCGDCVALDPCYVETPSGYIKSRFLDDKASCAILLTLAKAVADGTIRLSRRVALLFTEYEEIGHGGANLPDGIRDLVAVDIGCVGPDHDSDEHKVTICAKDASFPYHTDLFSELIALAEKSGAPYALDMMLPRYGSDADVALRAGYDVRHALIGPGVLETHGYERTHTDALNATLTLLTALVS